jgi:hypothetical protein
MLAATTLRKKVSNISVEDLGALGTVTTGTGTTRAFLVLYFVFE